MTAAAFTPGLSHAQRNISGTPEIQLALRKVNTLGGVLMIAAHPDDENSALLAYYTRGRNVRTGYLSLTRGEGGQNLIGSEQGDLLGVIRTQELLAARRIDGAEQFFTRAIDFGFSKSADETLGKWGREKVLSDIVWVIRRFRPDAIVLRFSGTPRDGHGQHQSSAMLGKEAFAAAADRSRFPEQLRYVEPWQATRLMWNVFSFTRDQEKEAEAMPHRIAVDTGEFNPLLGKSYAEIAGISRSMHRSQGMGASERRGPSINFLVTIAGQAAEKDTFDGVDLTWNRVKGGEAVGAILTEAERTFDARYPEKTIPLLLKARPLIAAIEDRLVKRKLEDLDEAIALCAGLWLDARADRYMAVPGSTLKIDLEAINRSHYPLNRPVYRVSGAGHSVSGGAQTEGANVLGYNEAGHAEFTWEVPADAHYSQPFWLQKPHAADTYDVTDQNLIGAADDVPWLTANFTFDFGGASITLRRPVHFRYVDPTEGEMTRAVVIVPPVAVNLAEHVEIFPREAPKRIEIELKANTADTAGDLRLELPQGWRAEPSLQQFRLLQPGDEQTLSFSVTPPKNEAQGKLRAIARVNGKEISSGMTVTAFPHFPPQATFPPAQAKLERANVVIEARKIGYVMGAGDQVPESLRQIGCEVTLLSPRDLAERNFAEFDAIVTGVRAYNVRPDLRANQQRLLDYVEAGGTMIVQYNVLQGFFGRGDSTELTHIGPYPLKVGRARVSVEEAPVALPDPGHPLLAAPNRITPEDFTGWIQERGLYFASEWDPHYQPVLESHDPTEKPQPGGMLYARYGKGIHIFTAYSWFRQLPAGVPGAYRIFANMLSARGAGARSAAVR
jgi:LmbE family N-acetylglucosaminyl deacetylase